MESKEIKNVVVEELTVAATFYDMMVKFCPPNKSIIEEIVLGKTRAEESTATDWRWAVARCLAPCGDPR